MFVDVISISLQGWIKLPSLYTWKEYLIIETFYEGFSLKKWYNNVWVENMYMCLSCEDFTCDSVDKSNTLSIIHIWYAFL